MSNGPAHRSHRTRRGYLKRTAFKTIGSWFGYRRMERRQQAATRAAFREMALNAMVVEYTDDAGNNVRMLIDQRRATVTRTPDGEGLLVTPIPEPFPFEWPPNG